MAMHAGELPIDADVARDLIDAQFPQWQGLHVRRVTSSGTDNAIFRLGDRLAARFPLQGADPAATRQELETEAAAVRELAAATRSRCPRSSPWASRVLATRSRGRCRPAWPGDCRDAGRERRAA